MATESETITTPPPAATDTSGAGAAPDTSTGNAGAPPDTGEPAQADVDQDDDNRAFLFDIEAWDGKAASLPEEYRPIGSRYEARLAELQNAARERDEFRLLIDALTDGQDDPRIAQHANELTAREAKLAEVQAAHDKIKADYDALMGEIQKAQEEQAREQWEAFKANHPALARSEKGRAQLAELLNAGFDFEQSAVVAEMPRKEADAVRELVRSGTPPAVAIELAQLRLGTKRKAEDTSPARVVAGAETPASNPAAMAEGRRGKRSYSEAADDAIAAAFRRTSR